MQKHTAAEKTKSPTDVGNFEIDTYFRGKTSLFTDIGADIMNF